MKTDKSHFNEAANSWDTQEKIARAHELANAIKRQAAGLKRPLRVMDIGCGTGLLSFEFAEEASSILGIDTSEGMLRVFAEKSKQVPGARGLNVDLEREDPPAGEMFDLIVSSMAFHHLENPAAFLRKLKPSLAPGGKFAIADLDKEDGSFHADPGKMGVRHFGFAEGDLRRWAQEAGLQYNGREIVYVMEKNGRRYPLFLAIFTS